MSEQYPKQVAYWLDKFPGPLTFPAAEEKIAAGSSPTAWLGGVVAVIALVCWIQSGNSIFGKAFAVSMTMLIAALFNIFRPHKQGYKTILKPDGIEIDAPSHSAYSSGRHKYAWADFSEQSLASAVNMGTPGFTSADFRTLILAWRAKAMQASGAPAGLGPTATYGADTGASGAPAADRIPTASPLRKRPPMTVGTQIMIGLALVFFGFCGWAVIMLPGDRERDHPYGEQFVQDALNRTTPTQLPIPVAADATSDNSAGHDASDGASPSTDSIVHTCVSNSDSDKDKRIAACTRLITAAEKAGNDKIKALAYEARSAANFNADHYDEAIADATESLRIKPGDGDVLTRRAAAYFAARNFQKSQDDVEAALKIDPTNAGAQRVGAMLAAITGQPLKAEADPNEAKAADPKNPAAAPKSEGAQQFDSLVQIIGLITAHKFDEAILKLDGQVASNPKDADALSMRALVRYLKSDFTGSLADADAALQWVQVKDANDPPTTVGMAWMAKVSSQDELGQRALAIEECGDWIKQTGKADAYQTRGWLLYKDGWTAQAQADVEKALSLEPNDPDSVQTRGFIRLSSGEAQAAIADFNIAIERDPFPTVESYWGRGQAFEKNGDVASAVADYQRAAALQPFGPEAGRMQTEARARLAALGK